MNAIGNDPSQPSGMFEGVSAVDTFWRCPHCATDAITQAPVQSRATPMFRALQIPDHHHRAHQATGELSARQAGCHLPKTSCSFPRPQAAHAKRHQQIFPRRLLLHQQPDAWTDGAAAICMRQLRT